MEDPRRLYSSERRCSGVDNVGGNMKRAHNQIELMNGHKGMICGAL